MMKREVIIMGVVQATQKDIELLARLMRSEIWECYLSVMLVSIVS